MTATVRRAAVAGTWYPGSADALARAVDGHLAAAGTSPDDVPGRLVGILSPHAGLHYSGPVAAYGYGLLRGRASLSAVLVGPSHHRAFDGVAVQADGVWQTPLGDAEIDADLAGALLAAAPGSVVVEPRVHRDEHSLEMQMPFLRRLVPSLRIVPLLMGTQSRREVGALAAALARVLAGRDVLLVASSDLSHYLPAQAANRADALVVEAVNRFDPESLLDRIEREDNVACGGGPIVAVMNAARALGADRAKVLRYADSGDVEPGDKSHVVGYLSAALTASAP